MPSVTRHTIRVYAALAALKGSGGDVLDALVPFFEPVLQVMHNKLFDPRLLVLGVAKLYHWQITPEVAEQFIPRLVQKKYLRRVGRDAAAAYVVDFPGLPDNGEGADIRDTLNKVLDEFEKFPPKVTDLLSYSKPRDELGDILIRFLVETGRFGQADPAEANKEELLAGLEEGGRPLEHNDRYMAARFTRHITENLPEYLPHLAQLAAIGLLTEVVEDFVRPTATAADIDLTIVLDAPLALDFLGVNGRVVQANMREVFGALKRIGCRLVVFPITCGEMTRNLSSMLSLPSSQRHGPTHSAMLRGEVLEDYVRSVANRPEDALEKVGIATRQMDLKQFPNLHTFFDNDRYEDFFQSIVWVADPAPREHDATCFALLMRLREGRHSSDLFRCRFVFATRNSAFARRSREYCIQSQLLTTNREGPVLHQREIATIAWLRTGLGGGADAIPRTELVASCERVLRVRPEVLKAIRSKLNEITPEKIEQLELLLQDQRSVRKLGDATLNDESVITTDNVPALLEMMRKETAEEERKIHAEELEAVKRGAEKRHSATAERHKEEIRKREERLGEVETRLGALKEARETAERRNRTVVDGAVDNVNIWLQSIAALFITLFLVLGGLLLINYFTNWFIATSFQLWLGAILFILGLYRMVCGFLDWPTIGLRTIQHSLAKKLLRRELRRRNLDWLEIDSFTIGNGRISFNEKATSEPIEMGGL